MSPMYEHNESFEEFPVVDLPSGEEDAFFDTSWDEEITRKLFGDLNHGLLGPSGNDNIIILSDFDEEEEVRKDDHADVEAMPSSAENSPAPTASATEDDDTPDEVPDDSNGGGDETSTS
jgi:hypothetical protein